MGSILDLLAAGLQSIPVRLSAGSSTVAPVSRGTMDLVRAALPTPDVPRDANDRPLLDDPLYISICAERDTRILAAQVAIAVGWKDEAGRCFSAAPDRATWIASAARWIERSVSDEDALSIVVALRRRAGGPGMGNPSSGQQATLAVSRPDGSRTLIT